VTVNWSEDGSYTAAANLLAIDNLVLNLLAIDNLGFEETETRDIEIFGECLLGVISAFPELRETIRFIGTMNSQAEQISLAINNYFLEKIGQESPLFIMQTNIGEFLDALNTAKEKAKNEYRKQVEQEETAKGRSYLPDCFDKEIVDNIRQYCGIGINFEKLNPETDAVKKHIIFHEIGHHFAYCFNIHDNIALADIALDAGREITKTKISELAAYKLFDCSEDDEYRISEYVAELLASVFENCTDRRYQPLQNSELANKCDDCQAIIRNSCAIISHSVISVRGS